MKTISGIELPYFPISDLKHVRDLAYFDGPLLSHYEHSNGDDFLYYWCDCDDHANRWMVLRVNEASVLRLIDRFVPLRFVIPESCRDDFVYLLDIDNDGGILQTKMVAVKEVPDNYKPKAEAYLTVGDARQSEDSYSILVEGGWSVHDLGDFPKTFEKVYSVLYGLNVLHLQELDSLPWRGGFSSMHFFNNASRRIPAEHRPSVWAIQVASPGFMKFKLHGPTASQVNQCIADSKSNNESLSAAYSDLFKYIRDNDLNDIENSVDVKWAKHNSVLSEKALAVMREFRCVDERDFVRACPRPFEAAKIGMAFYRYVRDLRDFEKNGLVRYSGGSMGDRRE